MCAIMICNSYLLINSYLTLFNTIKVIGIRCLGSHLQSPACPSAVSALHTVSISPAGVSFCNCTKHFRFSPFFSCVFRFGGNSVSNEMLCSCTRKLLLLGPYINSLPCILMLLD